jgi:hypothetical protein
LGRVKDANLLFDKMIHEENITLQSFVRIININFLNRRFERVLEIYEIMIKKKVCV